MKKVVTTEQSQVLGVVIKELGHVAPAGVLFECTDARFEVLAGKNGYHAIFVREAGKVEEPAPAVEEKIIASDSEEIVEEPEDEIIDSEEIVEDEPVIENEAGEALPKKKKKK